MNKSKRWSLLALVALALGGLGWTIATKSSPQLGLDLQGGTSAVLAPKGEADSAKLSQARDIIERRVNGLGVAEPEVSIQGGRIVVDLPGVKDKERALAVVGRTAELRFRPVLQVIDPFDPNAKPASTSTSLLTVGEGGSVSGSVVNSSPGDSQSAAPGSGASTSAAASTAGSVSANSSSASEATSRGWRKGVSSASTSASQAASEVSGSTATSASTPADSTTTTTSTLDLQVDEKTGITSADDDAADKTVLLPEVDNDGNQVARYVLGPTVATGNVISDANAVVDGGRWKVLFNIKGSEVASFEAITGGLVERQLAIVLDHVVESAPTIQSALSSQAEITGDFSEREAKDLALVLRYGSLPIELKVETVQEVSASLGRDTLDAGLITGAIGLGLVLLYMLIFYRRLGLVVVGGLALSGALMWSFVTWQGKTSGLALTLSGVVGLVVSVGVTVDSYVVFFERLKDELRHGASVRGSVERGFSRAFRTIIAADLVSFIAAMVLWTLSVGAVRGFAFFLGVSTVLDVVIAYVFTRVVVMWLARRHSGAANTWLGKALRNDSQSWVGRLERGETNFDFMRKAWRGFAVSGAILLIGLVALISNGLNAGIDFRGGTAWEVKAPELSVAEARDALRAVDLEDAKIQILGSDTVRVQANLGDDTNAGRRAEIAGALAEAGGVNRTEVSVSDVSATWGNSVTQKAVKALIVFFLVIALYISLRFSFKMAIAALVAVLHDILLTVGVYALLRFEVTPSTVIAFLTILGFSLYDTIVVFDKVKENDSAAGPRMGFTNVLNLSMNQVLMRSINTSFVAILPIATILFVGAFALGATPLKDFGLALFVGLVTGAYSSIFIAGPLLGFLMRGEQRYAKAKTGPLTSIEAAALVSGGATDRATESARVSREGLEGDDQGLLQPAAARLRSGAGVIEPRARKKR